MNDPMNQNTLFIDTNLDTHLALGVSDTDTVADLKRKIMHEHPVCFPDLGQINIHAVKVERKGCFYHLSDYMPVERVFARVNNGWFLSIDASRDVHVAHATNLLSDDTTKTMCITGNSGLHDLERGQVLNQNAYSAGDLGPGASTRDVPKDLVMEVKHLSGEQCKTSSGTSSEKMNSGIQEKSDVVGEENEMGRLTKHSNEICENGVSDLHRVIPLKDDVQGVVDSEKNRRAKRKFEALEDSSAQKVIDDLIDECGIQAEPNDERLTEKELDAHQNKRRKMEKRNKESLNEKEACVDDEQETTTVDKHETVTASTETSKPVNLTLGCTMDDKHETIIASTEALEPVNSTLGGTKDDIQETKTGMLDEISTLPLNDDSLIGNNSVREKRKTKKKKQKKMEPSSSHNDVSVAADPCSREGVRQEVQVLSNEDVIRSEPCVNSQEVGAVQDVLMHESIEPVDKEEIDLSIKEAVTSSKILADDEIVVPVESVGKEKEPKKSKKKDGLKQVTLPVEQANSALATEFHITADPASSNKENDKVENVPPETTVTEVADDETASTLNLGMTEKVHKVVDNVHLESPVLRAAKGMKKSRKKVRRNEEDLPDVQMKEQDVGHDESKEKDNSKTVHTLNLVEPEKAHKVHDSVDDPVQPVQSERIEESLVQPVTKGSKKSKKKSKHGVENLSDVRIKGYDVAQSTPLVDESKEKDRNEAVHTSSLIESEKAHKVHENIDYSEQPKQSERIAESIVPVVKGTKKSKKKSKHGIENLSDVQIKDSDIGHSTPSVDESKEKDNNKIVHTSSMAEPEKAHKVHENIDDSVQSMQSEKIEESLVLPVVKGNKKSKKKSKPGVENISDVQTNDHDVAHSTPSIEKAKVPSKKKKKSNLVETGSENLTSGSILQSKKGTVNQSDVDPLTSLANENIKQTDNSRQQLNEVTGSVEAFGDNVIDVKISEGKIEAKISSERVDPHGSDDNHDSETESKVGNLRSGKPYKLMPRTPISSHAAFSKTKEFAADKSGKNKSNTGKTLLAITGNIFEDGDGISSDDDGSVDSDETKAPSDNFSSSDESDVEKEAYIFKRKVDDSNSQDLMNMGLGTILKSSSRFKKAKITASQCQNEDLETVPDSQPVL